MEKPKGKRNKSMSREEILSSLSQAELIGLNLLEGLETKSKELFNKRLKVGCATRAPFYVENKKFHVRGVQDPVTGKARQEILWVFYGDENHVPTSQDIQTGFAQYYPIELVTEQKNFETMVKGQQEKKTGRPSLQSKEQLESTQYLFKDGKMYCNPEGYQILVGNALNALTAKNKINASRKTAYENKANRVEGKILELSSRVITRRQKKTMDKIMKKILNPKTKKGRVNINISPAKKGAKELLKGFGN